MKATFSYTGIRVKNLEESIKFYTSVLGMKEQGRGSVAATGGENVSLVSEAGGQQLELNYYPKGTKYGTDYNVGENLDHLAFKIDDLDRALEQAAKLGHPKSLEMKSGESRWAYIKDPNGIYIELFS